MQRLFNEIIHSQCARRDQFERLWQLGRHKYKRDKPQKSVAKPRKSDNVTTFVESRRMNNLRGADEWPHRCHVDFNHKCQLVHSLFLRLYKKNSKSILKTWKRLKWKEKAKHCKNLCMQYVLIGLLVMSAPWDYSIHFTKDFHTNLLKKLGKTCQFCKLLRCHKTQMWKRGLN